MGTSNCSFLFASILGLGKNLYTLGWGRLLRRFAFRREIDARAGVSDGIPYEMGPSGAVLTPEQGFRTHLLPKWAFGRRFGARAKVSSPPAAKRRPRAPATTKRTRRNGALSMQCALTYWMRVRQYGHTFQSALSGRWHVGQTFLTCVLQMGHTTKSRSMGAPHLGQMP